MADAPKIIRNPERTRLRILEAAIEEFSIRTLDGARVDAIAERAGVNKRMLYHYFGDKDALFAAALESVFANARHHLQGPHKLSEDPETAIRQMVDGIFAFFEVEPRITALVNCANLHHGRHLRESPSMRGIMDARIARIGEIVDRGRRRGIFRDDADPAMLVLTMTAMIFYFFANNATLSVFLDQDLADAEARTAWRLHIADFLLRTIRRPGAGRDAPDTSPAR